jgi:hypothetical protein
MTIEFEGFEKIPRLSRPIVITEKIDGTNAQIYISEDLQTVLAGSKNRWITPEKDNHGFARWVEEHREDLLKLGPGRHFGEWWGQGIQRGYGLGEKRFSLFNVHRWIKPEDRPACCHVVPVIIAGEFDTRLVEASIGYLRMFGSQAAPGFMNPEGVVIYHAASRGLFKKTLVGDEKPKGISNEG